MNQLQFYLDFYNRWNGKYVNKDGYYGAQCWDGTAQYEDEICGHVTHTDIHGYACDIWESRKTNGILNNFVEVSVMQAGDICVFKKDPTYTPYSHIAIFHSDIDGKYGWFFGQNQGGTPVAQGGACFNLVKLPYSITFDTAFRPKKFLTGQNDKPATGVGDNIVLNEIPNDFIKESATFYPNTTIKIRKAPSLRGQDTGLVYKKGMSVIYDGYVKREGYVWISWIGQSGSRRWMAAGELNSAGYNVNPYGTFK